MDAELRAIALDKAGESGFCVWCLEGPRYMATFFLEKDHNMMCRGLIESYPTTTASIEKSPISPEIKQLFSTYCDEAIKTLSISLEQ